MSIPINAFLIILGALYTVLYDFITRLGFYFCVSLQ